MFLLTLIFRDDGHLYANCLLYIVAIYCKCLFFSTYIVAYVSTFPSEQGFKNDTLAVKKMVIFC